MTGEEARQIVSRYLTGGAVNGADLQAACKVLNSADPEYVSYLQEEFGLGEAAGACQAFRWNAAEMGELTPEERQAEMPELVEHLAVCQACRRFYWEIHSPWKTEGLTRTLAEPIRLEAGGGDLREAGRSLAPPPLVETASVQLGLLRGRLERKQWRLPLAGEADLWLRLIVAAIESEDRLQVRCQVEGEGAAAPEFANTRIEISGPGGAVFSGSLAEFQNEPARVDRGAWRILLETASGRWEVPLEVVR